MRIGVVSTFPPIECGIATYSQYLTESLKAKGNEVFVFSEFGGKGENVFSSYSSKNTDIAANVFFMASKMTPDILHIQYEFGLYGELKGIQIIELILRCKIAGLPVVTTLHTVKKVHSYDEEIVLRVIVHESSAVIVHDKSQKKILADAYHIKDKVHVIPHGVRELPRFENAKEIVGVKNKKVLLLCGYLRKTKRYDRIIKVFPAIADAVDNAVLVIAAKSRDANHPEFQKELYKMIEDSPASDKIEVLHGQFPQKAFDTLISAADVVALPYELGAQSGIMAHCFAHSKPVVASNLESFRNWIEESQGGLTADSDEELQKHIIKILNNDEYAQKLSRNIARFVSKKTSWRVVADMHMEIYEKYSWRPTPKSRYFG